MITMNVNKKLIIVTAVIAVVAIAGAAIILTANNDDQSDLKGQLRVGFMNKIENVGYKDPGWSQIRGVTVSESLVKFNTKDEYVPLLATEWSTDDSIHWTFKLRPNVTWHDGNKVTVEDVKFTFEYIKEKKLSHGLVFEYLDTIKIIDNSTLLMTLKTANFNFLTDLCSLKMLPKHIFENVAEPGLYTDAKAAIGCGPYKFESFEKASGTLMLKYYENYYGGTPSVKSMMIKLFNKEEPMMMALKNGEIDVTYRYANGASIDFVPRLESDPKINIMRFENRGVPQMLWFNTEKAPFDNLEFRKAIMFSIDYNEVKTLLAGNYGKIPNRSLVPEGTFGFKQTTKMAQNINESKALLDKLGFKDKDGDGYREKPDGTKFKPSIYTKNTNDCAKVCELLKTYMKNIGVDVTVEVKESLGDILDAKPKTHEMAVTGTTPWGMKMWRGYATGYIDMSKYGWTATVDPAFKKLISDMANIKDKNEQRRLAGDLQDWYAENLHAIPLYWADLIQPHNKRISGLEVDAMYGIMSHETFFNLKFH